MTAISFILFLPWLSAAYIAAWSIAPTSLSRHPIRSSPETPKSATTSSRLAIPTHHEGLSSAYDKNLPPSMVGEAVRAALRSDRGVCFDFSSNRYHNDGSTNREVSVVKVRGEGTRSFLNAKFSQSVPQATSRQDPSPDVDLIRSGLAFESGYLNSKGWIIDRILILTFLGNNEETEDEAFLITSPGNSGSNLYDELSPLVFPMDRVELTHMKDANVMNLACSTLKDAQISFNNNVLGFLSTQTRFGYPSKGNCNHYQVGNTDVYILENTLLSNHICHGYTIFTHGDDTSLSNKIWNHMTAEDNNIGPVGVGALEYETLRIEAGIPGHGYEMMWNGSKKKQSGTMEEEEYYSKANPLELHLQNLIDMEKGCYQGQEGVASMLKNPRGCPRMLYQVVFYDCENDFDGSDGGSFLMSIDNKKLREFQQLKKTSTISNDTRQPRPGDQLYALGSNQSILVGKITSVAQPNGTGSATTVALALIRRADSILKSIKEQNLEMPRWWETPGDEEDEKNGSVPYGATISRDGSASGIINPPPLDPLVNLEVTIAGTYTIGRLQAVPSRRHQRNDGDVASILDYEGSGQVVPTSNDAFIQPEITVVNDGKDEDQRRVIDVTIGEDDPFLDDIAEAEKEAEEAAAKAEKAAEEAKRKAKKMELLKAKAEAAMAARREKRN